MNIYMSLENMLKMFKYCFFLQFIFVSFYAIFKRSIENLYGILFNCHYTFAIIIVYTDLT